MGSNDLQDDVQSLGFTPRLAKPEIEKKVGRRRDERVKWVRVTRRAGKEGSERRSRTGEDEKQPMMERLAAR